MKVRGEVFSGTLRGEPLIEKYYARLIGLVGFRPFGGTMDVKLERNVDIRSFTSKSMEHTLADGRKKITAYLAPVKIRKFYGQYKIMEVRDNQKRLLKDYGELAETAKVKISVDAGAVEEDGYECWAVQFRNGIYDTSVIELVARDSIKDTLGVGDGDSVEIEFSEETAKGKRPGWLNKNHKSLYNTIG